MSSITELEAACSLLQLSQQKVSCLGKRDVDVSIYDGDRVIPEGASYTLCFEQMEPLVSSTTGDGAAPLFSVSPSSLEKDNVLAVSSDPLILIWLVDDCAQARNPHLRNLKPEPPISQSRRVTSRENAKVLHRKTKFTRLNRDEKRLVYQSRLERKLNPKGSVMKPSDVSKTKGKLSHLTAESVLQELEKCFEEITMTSVTLLYQTEGLTRKSIEDEIWNVFEQEHPDEDIMSLRSDNRSARRAKAETVQERKTRLIKCNRKAGIRSRISDKVEQTLIAKKRISVQKALATYESSQIKGLV
ncbi:hypothetical protein HDE_12962 [Halotydeus destructor]|nr:hypothetical protein HDE_12962 [Halotydeus destructor]